MDNGLTNTFTMYCFNVINNGNITVSYTCCDAKINVADYCRTSCEVCPISICVASVSTYGNIATTHGSSVNQRKGEQELGGNQIGCYTGTLNTGGRGGDEVSSTFKKYHI